MTVNNKNGNELIYIFETDEGILIMPEKRAVQIFKYKKSLEALKSWGDFKRTVKPEVYDLCFLMFFEYRKRSRSYIAIPEDREKDPKYNHFTDDNLSFDPNIGHYLGALHKFGNFGKEVREWIHPDLKKGFGPSLGNVNLSRDIYKLYDKSRIEEFCLSLGKYGLNFVCLNRDNIITIYTQIPKGKGKYAWLDYESKNKIVYKINNLSTIWELPQDLITNYALEVEKGPHSPVDYYLSSSRKFPAFCAELKRSGYIVSSGT